MHEQKSSLLQKETQMKGKLSLIKCTHPHCHLIQINLRTGPVTVKQPQRRKLKTEQPLLCQLLN